MRAFQALALFVEVLVIATFGAMIAFGRLPASPAGLVWLLVLLLFVSAAVTFAVPNEWAARLPLHGALIAGAVLFALPFVWLIGTSFKYPEETFVTPPRWVPAVAHPKDVSPYVAAPPVASADMTEDARAALWNDARVFLPVGQLERVDETTLRPALLDDLLGDLPEPSAGEATPQVRVTADRVNEALNRTYRAFILGTPSLRNADGESFNIPADAREWSPGPGAKLVVGDDGITVNYDLTERDDFALTLNIDDTWLDQNVPAGEPLGVIALGMRQDRTWHRYDVTLEHDGKRYQSDDSLYLGDYRWREVSFRPRMPGSEQTDAIGRDERSLGVFPLYPVDDGPAVEPGTRLTMTVHKTGTVAATWAKYTQTYRDAWYADPYWGLYLFNSLWLVALNILGQIIACSMAAYAFSRLEWPGRNSVFILLLSTMMLPTFVTMVPTFLIFRSLGWYNTLLPLWVPAFAGTPFYIFLLRQFMLGIPRELEEAARIDGCSWFGIYWRIVMPLMKPALATVAIFTFMATWNEFMGPLIYLSDERLFPLSLGLFKFRTQFGSDYGMLMAASTLMTLPVILVFFLCQRYFIEGATLTGLKG